MAHLYCSRCRDYPREIHGAPLLKPARKSQPEMSKNKVLRSHPGRPNPITIHDCVRCVPLIHSGTITCVLIVRALTKQPTNSTHIADVGAYKVVVVAQEVGAGVSEYGDEVNVVRVPHDGLELFRRLSPWDVMLRG